MANHGSFILDLTASGTVTTWPEGTPTIQQVISGDRDTDIESVAIMLNGQNLPGPALFPTNTTWSRTLALIEGANTIAITFTDDVLNTFVINSTIHTDVVNNPVSASGRDFGSFSSNLEGSNLGPRGQDFSSTGYGVLFPFAQEQGDFDADGGTRLINASIGNILGTFRVARLGLGEVYGGERLMRPTFGSRLLLIEFENNDYDISMSLARDYVYEALASWEPRIEVTNVEITIEDSRTVDNLTGNVLRIKVGYNIKASGNQGLFETLIDVSAISAIERG